MPPSPTRSKMAQSGDLARARQFVEETYWTDGSGPAGVDDAAWRMAVALRQALPHLRRGAAGKALAVITEELLRDLPEAVLAELDAAAAGSDS